MMERIRPMLGRAKRYLRRRFAARPLILMYHRIAEEQSDPWRVCVSPSNFEGHLKALRLLDYNIVHVSELALKMHGGAVPRRTIAITFDDGYRDNLENGRPLLERYGAPATLFATAGYIGSNEEFWWDVLERIFLQPGSLPPVLELSIEGQLYRRRLEDAAELSASDAFRWPDWKPFREAPTARHELHDNLWRILVGARPQERTRTVSALLEWAGLDAQARPSRRPLSVLELRQLRGDGLVQIGAHSLTHPALPGLPEPVVVHELTASKSQLEEILNEPVLGFSYPQGRSSEETEREVRRAGYTFACCSVATAVPRNPDLFLLPRVSIGNWEASKFMSFVENNIAA